MEMNRYQKFVARLIAISRSVVTIMVLAVAAFNGILSSDYASDIPDGWATIILRISSLLIGAITVIRQVTPVPKEQRGLISTSS